MVTPATGNFERTDLLNIYNVVQNSIMSYPKELIIGVLRNEFSKDSYYHYVADEFGFPKTPDLTDVAIDAGLNDDITTRLFIGEIFRFNAVFYPAILVKVTNVKSIPISFNRNKYTVENDKLLVVDGYGNQKEVFIPKYFDLAGAYESSISIDIIDRDIVSRDNLAGIIMMMFNDLKFEAFRKAGLVIKPPTISGISEGEDRQQEKIYKATINLDIRSEWRRLIPIDSLVDKINICIDIMNLHTKQPVPELEINTYIDLADAIENM